MDFNYKRPGDEIPFSVASLDTSFLSFPRVRFIKQETPLEHLGRLKSGANLWIKRDDLSPIGLGGNKVRKLEFILAEAIIMGATDIVSAGAEQSNHLRITAACCAKLGLRCHLFFASVTGEATSGNQDLAKLFGAQIHIIKGTLDDAVIAAEKFVADLSEKDHKTSVSPYFIPPGGSIALGCLAYALCYSEITHQLNKFALKSNFVYLAASTMGTLSGLICGASLMLSRKESLGISLSSLLKIRAVNVDSQQSDPQSRILSLCKETLSLLNKSDNLNTEIFELVSDKEVVGSYGVPTKVSDFALRYAAETYGLLLDRTYTAKAFAQILVDDVNMKFKASDNIIFLHTGGIGANFSVLDNCSIRSIANDH